MYQVTATDSDGDHHIFRTASHDRATAMERLWKEDLENVTMGEVEE